VPDRMPTKDVVRFFADHIADGLPITKLMKLVFLADIEHQQLYGEPLTTASWTFYDYGPFTRAVYQATEALEEEGVVLCEIRPVYAGAERRYGKSDGIGPADREWHPRANRALNQVLEKYGHMTVSQIKTVAYATETMRDAKRGARLDLSREPRPYEFSHPDLDAFLATAPPPDIRSYGDPAASAAEDLAIMRGLAPLRRAANRTIDD